MKLFDTIQNTISGDWGNDKYQESSDVAVKCLRSADIVPIYQFDYSGIPIRYVSYKSLKNKQLQDGDIVIEKSGGTDSCSTGRPIYISSELLKSNEPLLCSNFCSAIRLKDGWNTEYVYYLLRQIHKLGLFFNFEGKTSGIHNLDMEAAFKAIEIPDLSYKEQDSIATILSALDRKIALNRKENEILEKMAKQLYDYWFVQFDFPDENGRPYKSSGGKMVYNETLKREIPEGWEVKNLPYIAKFENGIACQKYRPDNNDRNKLRVIKIDEMHNGFSNNTEYVNCNIPNSAKIYDGDILFSWSASLDVMLWDKGVGALNQHIFKVTPINGFSIHQVYFQLTEYVDYFRKIAESRKTTMGHITQDHLIQSTICVPSMNHNCLLDKFENLVEPSFNTIIKNSKETQNLTSLRDYLLPLLMNGQVTIKD